jgi:antitoxin VapB
VGGRHVSRHLVGTEVLIRREGDPLILTLIRPNRLIELLATWAPLDDVDALPEVEDLPPQGRPEL